ncbi:putative sugar transporter [Neurospora crassa]|uniref:MFS monosaccharide transporter n=2 Tax=Neurospora crassa TaxID=5141 RepID=F5HC09_NEUCR|nr:MFS monosaccharide transporter [Neurospora crassa OR74A]EAA31803.2 MFS monosaccharide transporter [Neurospora crassa OR74A]KHE88243.1 putative sugar transporter [Neurospora crassa]CAB88582.2 probable sugar transporter [Neurospora crassa]|eukprot:XP_961039.2 MFS monosaccharide transporter [Neurospora crassa OR74A]
MKPFLGLRGQPLNLAVGAVAGCDFLLFGYDQGVMGGILTLPEFLGYFEQINPDAPGLTPHESSMRSTYQGISVASYNLGCFIGAIITIFIGNPWGRKKIILLGTSIMIVGAILQASATTLGHFIIGRIITGIGNGGNTSTVPTWQSETSKAHKRGKMVMIEGSLVTAGIMLSYWIDLGLSFAPGSVAWRFPLAFQIIFCILILIFIPFLPESPRWLVFKGRDAEAKEILAALNDVELDDPIVDTEFHFIHDTVVEMSKGSFKDLFTMDKDRNFHRTLLAYLNQVFQQISGINLITYYAAVIYSGLGMSDFLARLLAALNGTEYFIASWPAVFLVERVGRRKLMLFGAIGQAATMAILAGVNSRPDDKPYQIAGIVFLFVFNTVFAVGWLGMSWLYPAEIVPLRIRAPANALSTSANWIFNFMVVMITPVAFNKIKYQTYIIFAVINAFIVPVVYFFYPETACRSLEEMDMIFHKVDGWKGYFTVVHQAKVEPKWYDKDGQRIGGADFEKTAGYQSHSIPESSGFEKPTKAHVESPRADDGITSSSSDGGNRES